jgi:hypothetical protein
VAVVAAWPGSMVQTNPSLSARREEPREWVEAVLILFSNATHWKTSRAFTSISKLVKAGHSSASCKSQTESRALKLV